MIRDIIGFLVALAVAAWILFVATSGMRTGRIRHTDSTSAMSFHRNPIKFALLVVLFVVVAVAMLYAALERAIAIWQRLGHS
jgi:uncharacterized membrane protein